MSISYRHLLVPLDGSPLAAQALPHAQAIAAQAGAQLTLLQVVPDMAAVATGTALPGGAMTSTLQVQAIQAQWLDQTRANLNETVDSLIQEGIQAQAVVSIGFPADGILDFAQHHGVDLVVMSTHGRSGLARFVFGSVAARVVQGIACPVLLIRSIAGRTAPAPRKIMVTLDGTGLATHALPDAERMVHLFDAEILLLRVVTNVYEHNLHHVPATLAPQVAAYTGGMLTRLVDQVGREMDGIARDLAARSAKVSPRILVGEPVSTILDQATSEAVDLLVMCTHARAGMARLLHGSVAERVLHDTPCPVLLVRAASA